MPAVPEASSILASLGQAAFLWDLTADTIAWTDNAGPHEASHTFAAALDPTTGWADWELPTGTGVRTRWVEFKVEP